MHMHACVRQGRGDSRPLPKPVDISVILSVYLRRGSRLGIMVDTVAARARAFASSLHGSAAQLSVPYLHN